jgi:hypothetical protein
VAGLPDLTPRFNALKPGHGWAAAGLDWRRDAGWMAFAEVGHRLQWGDIYARAQGNQDQAQVAIGARW